MEPCDFCGRPVAPDDEHHWGNVMLCPSCDKKLTEQYIRDREDKKCQD